MLRYLTRSTGQRIQSRCTPAPDHKPLTDSIKKLRMVSSWSKPWLGKPVSVNMIQALVPSLSRSPGESLSLTVTVWVRCVSYRESQSRSESRSPGESLSQSEPEFAARIPVTVRVAPTAHSWTQTRSTILQVVVTIIISGIQVPRSESAGGWRVRVSGSAGTGTPASTCTSTGRLSHGYAVRGTVPVTWLQCTDPSRTGDCGLARVTIGSGSGRAGATVGMPFMVPVLIFLPLAVEIPSHWDNWQRKWALLLHR